MSATDVRIEVLGKPALRKGQGAGSNLNAYTQHIATKEAEAERRLAPIRADVSLYRRLMPHIKAESDGDFLGQVEDLIREACFLGPASLEGRRVMIQRVVTWAHVNTALARRCLPDIADNETSDANWIEALRQHLIDHHAHALGQAQTSQT